MSFGTFRPAARSSLRILAAGCGALLLSTGVAQAKVGLIAFGAQAAARQGSFEAGGVSWTCNGELCGGDGPEDRTLWPSLCAALVREAGPVVAFGSLAQRFDGGELERCNREGAQPAAPTPPPPAPTPATPAAVAAAPPTAANLEICNGADDDGDGEIDEGVRLTVWADRDHDLYGDPGSRREICPHELAPGWVVNDFDCDDGDRRRNPARDNCPAPPDAR
jgi:hypothetical protein